MDTSDIILQLALLLCVFGALYLVLVRPQQLRLQQHKLMLANLQLGDRVATNGGLVGTITSIDDQRMVTVEIAPDTRVSVLRKSIDEVISTAYRHDIPEQTQHLKRLVADANSHREFA